MNIFTTILIQPLANGLILFYRILFENMGLAIIGFSLALVLALRPLTKQYLNSMKKMKDYAPQLEKLKKKYKNDKTKLMKAQSDFYKQKGINPGAGCLPMILQLVLLFALFQVFTRALATSDVTKLNELLYAPLKFAHGAFLNTRFLYLNITKPDTFKIALIPFAIPGPILLLSALAQMISAKITSPYLTAQEKLAKKTENKTDDFQTAMQSSAVYTFPLMTLLFGSRFPSGIALYWLTFSLYQAYQQYQTTGLGGLKGWLKLFPMVKSGNEKRN